MSDQNNLLVYIVDDDKMYSNALKHYLETSCSDLNLHIEQFIVGETLLMSIDKKPNIIILDYHLNSKFYDAVNGLEILKEIKRVSPDSKVIVVSGQDQVNIAVEAIAKGATDYIVKNKEAYEKIKTTIIKINEDRKGFFDKVKDIFKK